MAKGQKKTNREVRKPKQEKPKTQVATGSFSGPPVRIGNSAGKKPGK